jgi:hypothetical protein
MLAWLRKRIAGLTFASAATVLFGCFFLFAIAGAILQTVWPGAALVLAILALVPLAAILVLVAVAGLQVLRSLLFVPLLPLYALILRRAARALGWPVPWLSWPSEVGGHVDGLAVRVSRPHLGDVHAPVQISVFGPPGEIEIEGEGLGSLVSRVLGDRDVLTGDAAFDRRLFVKGKTPEVLSALDAETREALLRLSERGNVRVDGGLVRVETRRVVASAKGFVDTVRAVVALVKSAPWSRRVAQGLAENARRDPVPEVRLSNLKALDKDWPSQAREVWNAALSDPNELVRAHAAIREGPDGQEMLLDLAASPTLKDEYAAEVIRALGAALTEPRTLEILADALRRERDAVARAAIEALALRGTVLAVAPLRSAIEYHLLDFGLRRSAQAAIARIQSRLEGAEAGQISIAVGEGEAGQLSLNDGAAGALSLDQGASQDEGGCARRDIETE